MARRNLVAKLVLVVLASACQAPMPEADSEPARDSAAESACQAPMPEADSEPARDSAAEQRTILGSTLGETDTETPEVSTETLIAALAEGSAVLLDTRPRLEWAISHIPGALNVAPKPGMPMSEYTSDAAEVGRLVAGEKAASLILYCSGPFCGKSKRVARDLLAEGYTDVSRYQLGTPVWRALGGVMVIEPEGARHVFEHDGTAVWIDVRDPGEFQRGSVPGAKNLPRSGVLPGKDVGEVRAAKDDGRLPVRDHNTRLIVFGVDGEQARAVAEALSREAFHNVTYFAGGVDSLQAALN
jgi:rhodanese-related sulfurtransferase